MKMQGIDCTAAGTGTKKRLIYDRKASLLVLDELTPKNGAASFAKDGTIQSQQLRRVRPQT